MQGFAYAYVKPKKEQLEIVVNDDWPGVKGPMKVNTVLQYDENYESVFAWGAKALATEPSKENTEIVETKEVFYQNQWNCLNFI